MSTLSVYIVSALAAELRAFVKRGELGRVIAECLFPLAPADRRQRRPDVAFVSYARWPKDRPLPDSDPWPVVPDLAVEVVSPTDTASEIAEKLEEYFRAGVRMVWVIYPKQRQALAYRSTTDVRGVESALEGGDVIPGFRLALAELFA